MKLHLSPADALSFSLMLSVLAATAAGTVVVIVVFVVVVVPGFTVAASIIRFWRRFCFPDSAGAVSGTATAAGAAKHEFHV